jgi:hypothetical protein
LPKKFKIVIIIPPYGPATDAARMQVREIARQLIDAVGPRVQFGPFAGTLLAESTSWQDGDIVPKILGCYEEELHNSMQKAIERRPEVVINIGCAEGYYATGLARRLPDAYVYAFDTDSKARAACLSAARQNGVGERIDVRAECRAEDLIALVSGRRRVFVVCDCEGGEHELFNMHTLEFLSNTDLIIECHDFYVRDIRTTLSRKFSSSHDVDGIREGARDPAMFSLLRSLGTLERWLAVCEFRPEVMYWLACWHK